MATHTRQTARFQLLQSPQAIDGAATPLGDLEKLPLEIRRMIYAYCCDNPTVLGVNATIYDENLISMQTSTRFGVLRLHVDPSLNPSTVQILNEYNRPSGSIDAASADVQSDKNPFRTMPVGLYRKISLEIEAPDTRDPGQVIRLCKQVSAVVKSLSAQWSLAAGLSKSPHESDCAFSAEMKISSKLWLEINFKESPERSWMTNGEWNTSLADHDSSHRDQEPATGNRNTDIGLVLQLLRQLRGMSLDLRQPKAGLRGQIWSIFRDVDALASMYDHFGFNWLEGSAKRYTSMDEVVDEEDEEEGNDNDADNDGRNDDQWFDGDEGCERPQYAWMDWEFSDFEIANSINVLQHRHDQILNNLPGKSAKCLRRERVLNPGLRYGLLPSSFGAVIF